MSDYRIQLNVKLYERICSLIAMNYALSKEEVIAIYLKEHSIDKVIEIVREK